jgi:hypothetical protein
MTDTPDPSVAPEPAPRASYVDHEPPRSQRAWPYAFLLAIFNFALGGILVAGNVSVPAVGLIAVAIEIALGLFLRWRGGNPRAARILLLTPLVMIGIVAGLFVLAWGICSTMGKF